MANIAIKDLEMDKALDNVSLAQIIGGHRCHRPGKICYRRRVKYIKRIAYKKKIVRWVTRFKFVPAYKTVQVCFWR